MMGDIADEAAFMYLFTKYIMACSSCRKRNYCTDKDKEFVKKGNSCREWEREEDYVLNMD